MMPNREQVRTEAHARWEANGRCDGYDLDDWLGAEQDLMLALNYELIAAHFLDGAQKVYIGNRQPRRCRYCGKDESQVSFKAEAHAIPEFLGNRLVIANDECDACNTFFSETIEDSLGKMTLPIRTTLAIRGKNGVPTHQSKDRGFRMEFDPRGPGFNVKDLGASPVLIDDPTNGRMAASFDCQPYVPVRILKCMAKIALAIMPASEIAHFDQVRRWILAQDDSDCLQLIKEGQTFLSILPGNVVQSWVHLYRRKTADSPMPYMIVVVAVRGLVLQSYSPRGQE